MQGIASYCAPGLGLNLFAVDNISGVQVAFMALTAGVIYYILSASHIFKKPWQTIVIASVGGVSLFLGLATWIIANAGGLKFALGVVITLWVTFRVTRYSKAIALSATLLLSVFAAYNLAEPFAPVSSYDATWHAVWHGRLLLFLGSLLMLSAVLLEKRAPHQETAQHGVPPPADHAGVGRRG